MTRRFVQRLAALLLLTATSSVFGQIGDHPFCQILDRFEEPIWFGETGYVTREKVKTEGGGHFGMAEFSAGSGVTYLQTGVGTLDLRAGLDTWFFVGDGGVNLPDQVGRLRLDLRWIHRAPSGFALQLGLEPGVYSDFEDLSGRDFFLPLNISAIQALHPKLSGLVGLAVFPGFERVVDPRIGLRWGISDAWLLDLFYPESRISFAPNQAWRFHAGLRALLYPEFQLREGDPRDRLRYSEWRWYGGIDRAINESVMLMVRAGHVFGRRIEFAEEAPGADVERAFFVRVGLGALL